MPPGRKTFKPLPLTALRRLLWRFLSARLCSDGALQCCWRQRLLTLMLALCTALVAGAPLHVNAKTWYITDYIHIRLLRDSDPASEVLKMLASGASVTEIKRHEEMIQVRTADGAVGWVKREHLRQFLPAMLQLKRVMPQMAQLEQQLTALEAQLATAKAALAVNRRDTGAAGSQPPNAMPPATGAAIREDLQKLLGHSQAIMQSLTALSHRLAVETNRNGNTMPFQVIRWDRLLNDFLRRPINQWHAWQWLLCATLLLLLLWAAAAFSRWLQPTPEIDRDHSNVSPPVGPAIGPTASPVVTPAVSPAVNPAVRPAVSSAEAKAVNPAVNPAATPAATPATTGENAAMEPLEEPPSKRFRRF